MKGRRAYEFSSDVFPGMSECKLLQDTGEHRNRSSDTSDRASGGNTYRIDPCLSCEDPGSGLYSTDRSGKGYSGQPDHSDCRIVVQ